jgi:pimeloyl-ACP methyl ester carboxylesterase
MRSAFVDIDGISTRYLYEGRGLPLLLVHGIGACADIWIRNIDSLGEDFSVFAPDSIGGGFTDIVPLGGAPPQSRMVAHLARFMDKVAAGQRFSIVGNSYGGLLACLLWFERPRQVDKLILVSSASTFHPAEEQKRTLERSFALLGPAIQQPSLDVVRERFGKAAFDPTSIPPEIVYSQFVSGCRPGRYDFYSSVIKGLIDTVASDTLRVFSRLEQIEAQTLIVTGRDDAGCSLPLLEEGCRRMPRARLEVFDRCAHVPMLEDARRFNRLAIDFLKN